MPAAQFRHAAIVGKTQVAQAQGSRGVLEEVAQFLLKQGLEVSVEEATAMATGLTGYDVLPTARIGPECDLGVVVGGDGTMLGFAREVAPHGLPLVGINQGRLGFITDMPLPHFREGLAALLGGEYEEDRRAMIEGDLWRDGSRIHAGQALNDVVVNRGASSGMVELRVDVGDEFVATMRADGLILATPTGSTAYALSAHGPILHPSIGGWVLVPIASHTLTTRPIVLPASAEVRITIVSGRDASVNFDMQSLTSLLHGDQVRVRPSRHQVRFLHPRGWSYYATLRKKLRWYES